MPSLRLITLFAASLFLFTARAEVAEVGKPFPKYAVEDAFGNPHSLSNQTRTVIMASEKDISGKVNDWLKTKGKDYLPQHKAEYVSDITPMPGIITTLFALPKMKKYPFTILLADDENFAKTYPAKKGLIAVYKLDAAQVLTQLTYVESAAEGEKLVEGK